MEDNAASFLAEWGKLKAARSTFDQHWQEVCERFDPIQARFFDQDRQQGAKLVPQNYDSTGIAASEKFSAIMESVLTPGGKEPWHTLTPPGEVEDLDPTHPVSVWLEQANSTLYKTRNSPKANFPGQQSQVYRTLGVLGTACLFIDNEPAKGIYLRYRAIHMSGVCVGIDAFGRVDRVLYRYKLNARQAVQEFSNRGDVLPKAIRDAALRSPSETFWFLHCVYPNPDVTFGKIGPAGMKFASRHVCEYDQSIVRRSGYRTMPYVVPRFFIGTNEDYGRSPAMYALGDQKMLNHMGAFRFRAAQRELDPIWLTTDDAVMTPLRTRPGSINGGMLNDDGSPRVRPMLPTGQRFEIDAAITDETRRAVNDFFYINLFQILVDTPTMTATEALIRAREKAALMAPPTTRMQAELLGPMVEREMDLLMNEGRLPPIPPELVEMGQYEIEYQSPYASAAEADRASSVLQTFNAVAPLVQFEPDILDNFRLDNMVRTVAKGFRVPADDLATPEEVQAKRDQAAKQKAIGAMAGAAKPVAGAVKDLAQAATMGAA